MLQAFRFFVRNNFLLDYAAGAPLQLPPPPAYPPGPAGPQWGRPLAEQQEGVQAPQVQPTDVQALLATVAKDAIDVELSDEEEEGMLGMLPTATAAQEAAAAAQASTGAVELGSHSVEGSSSEEEEGKSESESSDAGEDEEEGSEEEEEGQLVLQASVVTADPDTPDASLYEAAGVDADMATEQEDDLEFS